MKTELIGRLNLISANSFYVSLLACVPLICLGGGGGGGVLVMRLIISHFSPLAVFSFYLLFFVLILFFLFFLFYFSYR